MRKLAVYVGCVFLALIFLLVNFAKPAHASLYGIDWDTGNLYTISTTNASLTLIGPTGLVQPADLQFSPGGTLYSFTIHSAAGQPVSTLYTINPSTAVATAIGPLGLSSDFEGGLAFSPSGTAYGVNGGDSANPQLFTLNLSTGAATVVGTISGGSHDINGLAWRSDGKLIGIDRVTNSLLVIDPATASSSLLMALIPTVGGDGGMTALGSAGFFSTSGPGGSIAGSNQLYSFDLFTGSNSLIGSFPPTIGTGISGIAETPGAPGAVPEPSTMLLLGSGLIGLAGYGRKKFFKK